MTLSDLLLKNRSYRRFHEDERIDRKTLVELVELARLCPSAANQQPLKYMIVASREETAHVFPHLNWARALPDWPGPAEGERPAAYIIILGDVSISSVFHFDPGVAALTMLLGAVEKGLGGCMVGSIDREGLRKALCLPEHYAIVMVVALGRPRESVVLEESRDSADVAYWRDGEGVHHVPKRPLTEVLVEMTRG